MSWRPRGYIGIRHETIGSDILAIFQILKLPEHVLGAEDAEKLSKIDPEAWYPIEWLLGLMEKLDRQVGYYGLVQMGRTIFKLSHEERVLRVAKSARDIIYGINDMYHHANRGGSIGGWKVVKFEPGYAELEKNTPHHCVMEQGILTGALAAVGCPGSVDQKGCFRKGGEVCLFTISSSIHDERWAGAGRGTP